MAQGGLAFGRKLFGDYYNSFDFWSLITLIWTNLSWSCIKDSTKASREGIFQLRMEALPGWNVETKTEYFEPILLRIDRASCSSFLSNSHCLHCSTSDLYFVKNCWIVSKLLGCSAISPFSKISQEICVHMKLKASSSRFKKISSQHAIGAQFLFP